VVPQTGDWVLGSSFGGIDTFYRPTGDGRYMAKVVGAFENISVFDQLAVVRETALYSTWAPLVPWSNALAHPNGFKERVVHWQQNLAVLTRYGLCRACCRRGLPAVSSSCARLCCGVQGLPDARLRVRLHGARHGAAVR
jgi:DNA-directed RNA polymerase subunit N (RpoN/RPB10)